MATVLALFIWTQQRTISQSASPHINQSASLSVAHHSEGVWLRSSAWANAETEFSDRGEMVDIRAWACSRKEGFTIQMCSLAPSLALLDADNHISCGGGGRAGGEFMAGQSLGDDVYLVFLDVNSKEKSELRVVIMGWALPRQVHFANDTACID